MTSVTSQSAKKIGKARILVRTILFKYFTKITLIHYYSEDFTSFKEGPTETQKSCLGLYHRSPELKMKKEEKGVMRLHYFAQR